jgi:hypothetical protein
VSGSRKRMLDSLTVLDEIPSDTSCSCSVAYNPFLEENQMKLENQRLQAKLKHSCVNRVYIQIGIKPETITRAISYIRSYNQEVAISVCILYPSLRLLQNWQLRPWGGVFLDKKYLENLAFAQDYTRELLYKCNTEWGVDILLTWFETNDKLSNFLLSQN